MKYFISFLFSVTFFCFATAQMEVMDQSVYEDWKSIRSEAISADGKWVKYQMTPGKGDATLKLYDAENKKMTSYDRVRRSEFSEDGAFLFFTVGASQDTILEKRRSKVKKKDLPKDSLCILNVESGVLEVVPDVGTYKVPKEFSGIVAYQADVPVSKDDTTGKKEQKFIIHNLNNNIRDTIENIDEYLFAEDAKKLVFQRSGEDSIKIEGVFICDLESMKYETIIKKEGKYKNLNISKNGMNVSFIADLDTTKRRIRPYDLMLWNSEETKVIVSEGREGMYITENTKPTFSEAGNYLYYGVGNLPVLPDSLALEEDQVSVEVWTSEDPMLYTMQELQEDRLKKETFSVRYDIKSVKHLPLENEERKNLQVSNKGDGKYYVTTDAEKYLKAVTWTGRSMADIYLGNFEAGEFKQIKNGLSGRPSFSPGGQFLYWFDQEVGDWFTYDVENGQEYNLTKDVGVFTDELNDRPMKPGSYGNAGWVEGDEFFFIYDRFDIWKFDPRKEMSPMRLTSGRDSKMRHRVIDLDREEDFLSKEAFIYLFDEVSKQSGYGHLNLSTGEQKVLQLEYKSFSRRPIKGEDSNDIIFTKEDFEVFPDLLYSDINLSSIEKISDANPQQDRYRWGTIELFKWMDYDGDEVTGLLVKPEGFDPLKKYPVIVNFYERSSDGLHRHRAPEPHRSTINYSYYANKGYIIFNPDVKYKIGEPGASAYNAVISGVEALSKNQFVDRAKIGVQGHSWGGYQIAHLLNKTDIFACAESGAPVVNMVSAYGGIRWGSGMSRMFQYEKTQSRLGKTLWEDPEVYLRNSPIFEVDKMNTPVLILHNDNDGAVPWYQGIEYFMALRRLGKPAWFLNYNGEPHWPLKWENRIDFNRRMEQFFSHFLMDQPMPLWMKEGVNVVDKGVNQGFEVEERE